MLDVRARRLAERLLPHFLLRMLDPFEARVSERLSEFAATLPESSHLLDAGAGECRYAGLFSRQTYVALDNTVGDAAWDYSKLDAIGDLESIPFARSTFDAVISIVVLEHTHEPRRVISEMARVLRPGGKLFLVVPSQWEIHQAPHDYFRFTRYGVEYLLCKSGFRPVTLDAVGGFFWLLARRCVNLLTFFQSGAKWAAFILLAPFFGFLFPLLLYLADPLDEKREFTLGYVCIAERKADSGSQREDSL